MRDSNSILRKQLKELNDKLTILVQKQERKLPKKEINYSEDSKFLIKFFVDNGRFTSQKRIRKCI